ncbi:MAG: DsbC family protein [Gammaproteobacteria bacterium]
MRLFSVLVMLLVGMSAQADPAVAVEENIRDGLAAIAPDMEIDGLRESEIAGLYEVVLGAEVLYMSADGRYVMRGDMIDLRARSNVTEDVRAENRRKILASLDRAEMIEFTADKPEHFVYVFTDVDCGYCRKLHNDITELGNRGVSVRYLAYPRAGLDSTTAKTMESVWCADDRQNAMTRAKNGQSVKELDCNNPVAAQYKTGQQLGVRGTPAIYLEDGSALPGYLPPHELLSVLNGTP